MLPDKKLIAAIGGIQPGHTSLSPREAEALRLYASGFGQYQVARRMGISQASVKEHIDRVRAKYAHGGRPAPTKIDLFKRAIEDGLLPPVVPLSR
ncbi:response regulator transcription factor [Paenarthrobacter sp. Z7-10]|uniref:response regulator transcription factor n=1 Tax=Paenarthrobacter sp. Z7-10 TaxID=2787635 RepID=UPI0022A90E64|nr:LuxR C-terminal-related transcriptional regulator [Paenarthrobacter sp. Z7-10]